MEKNFLYRLKKIFLALFLFSLFTALSVFGYHVFADQTNEANTVITRHSKDAPKELTANESCPDLDWITATYHYDSGYFLQISYIEVIMKTQGITGGQTNTVEIIIFVDGQEHTGQKTASKTNISLKVTGKLWYSNEWTNTELNASYDALGKQTWIILGEDWES